MGKVTKISTKVNKTFKKWVDKINTGTLSETDIICLKSHISSGAMAKSLTDDDRSKLEEILVEHIELKNGLNITPEQAQKGIDYLNRKMFKVNGEPRNDKWNCWTDDDHREVVKNYSHFKFMGFYENHNHMKFYRQLSPIYRCFTKNGDYFDYTMQFDNEPGLLVFYPLN